MHVDISIQAPPSTQIHLSPQSHLSFHTFFPFPLPNLTITTDKPETTFDYFGIDDNAIFPLIVKHLQKVVSGNVDNLFRAFLDSVREFHLAPEHTAYWLTVRIRPGPTNEYDVPRWHQDGAYWDMAPEEVAYKVGAVFTGAPTLFLEPDE